MNINESIAMQYALLTYGWGMRMTTVPTFSKSVAVAGETVTYRVILDASSWWLSRDDGPYFLVADEDFELMARNPVSRYAVMTEGEGAATLATWSTANWPAGKEEFRLMCEELSVQMQAEPRNDYLVRTLLVLKAEQAGWRRFDGIFGRLMLRTNSGTFTLQIGEPSDAPGVRHLLLRQTVDQNDGPWLDVGVLIGSELVYDRLFLLPNLLYTVGLSTIAAPYLFA